MAMVKFLITGSYTAEGTKALAKVGGSQRKAAVAKMLEGMGGRLEAFYYAIGPADLYVIAEAPDTTSVAAVTLAVNGSGMVQISAVVLMTPEEIDAACRKTVEYRPPGA
jgi:uncharacterized protein with GYD domain